MLEKLRQAPGSKDELGRDSPTLQFLLVYRIEQKEIVRSNFSVVDYLIQVIQKAQVLKSDLDQNPNLNFDSAFKEIYLTTAFQPQEDQQTLTKGFEKNETGIVSYPAEFIERRQKVREYLKQLFTILKPPTNAEKTQ